MPFSPDNQRLTRKKKKGQMDLQIAQLMESGMETMAVRTLLVTGALWRVFLLVANFELL